MHHEEAATDTSTSPSFSARLKSATWNRHEEAESHTFFEDLFAGRLPLPVFTELVAQYHFVYAALEEVGRALADHPVAGAVFTPKLERVPALERDLDALAGPDWRAEIRPNRATQTYVARIRQALDWPAGYVAHHYTRYIGDLSGGQVIRKVAVRGYGLTDNRGVEFYVFDELGSLPAFKDRYRHRLDALQLTEAERRRVVDETRLAYQLNVEVLAALGRAGATAPAA